MNRHEFLSHVHRLARPRNYLEIGVNHGDSLALSRTRTIGVDPDFRVNVELACALQLVKQTSDDFFAGDDPLAWFAEDTIDFAFIDGMHLFEFALRDFINVEKLAHPGSVVVFDDMLPRNNEEASRERHTRFWAGDVFKVGLALQQFRPDLVLVPLDTFPTGTLLVANLDPTNTTLDDRYDEIVASFGLTDPADVPDEVLNRVTAADPEKVVASGLLEQLCTRPAGEIGPDLDALRALRGTASYVNEPFDNPVWPPPKPAKKAPAKKSAAPAAKPTIVRRFRRAARAFLR